MDQSVEQESPGQEAPQQHQTPGEELLSQLAMVQTSGPADATFSREELYAEVEAMRVIRQAEEAIPDPEAILKAEWEQEREEILAKSQAAIERSRQRTQARAAADLALVHALQHAAEALLRTQEWYGLEGDACACRWENEERVGTCARCLVEEAHRHVTQALATPAAERAQAIQSTYDAAYAELVHRVRYLEEVRDHAGATTATPAEIAARLVQELDNGVLEGYAAERVQDKVTAAIERRDGQWHRKLAGTVTPES